MKVAIGNDHTAVELKNHIKKYLEAKGYTVVNLGADTDESSDYPLYGEKVGKGLQAANVTLALQFAAQVLV